MKKFFAISFLCIYIFSVTELHQLLKLPLLIEHYVEHKEANKDLGLFGFLQLHYFNGDVHDSDYDKDMKLPFKSHDTCVSYNLSSFVPSDEHSDSLKIISIVIDKSIAYQEPAWSASFKSSIWQPPKFS